MQKNGTEKGVDISREIRNALIIRLMLLQMMLNIRLR